MTHPSFTIVVPTYRRRESMTDMVGRLATLDYPGPWEVIVVVDGSDDGTAAALRTLACAFPLQIVEQANAGAASARNRGAAQARNEVLLFIDDDMIFGADLLRQYAQAFADGADAACGDIGLAKNGRTDFLERSMQDWLTERSQALRESGDLSPFWVISGSLAVKAVVFAEIGGFDERYTFGGGYGAEDVDLGFELLERGYRIRSCPAALVEQRYDIGPRQSMARSARIAFSELRLARKHPEAAEFIRTMRQVDAAKTRWIVIPLARLRPLVWLVTSLAVLLAEMGPRLPRWLLSVVARLFRRASTLAYWARLNRLGGFPRSGELLALCYHAISDLSDDPVVAPYGTPIDEFESQLDRLLSRGFTFVSPEEVDAYLDRRSLLPRKAVLLTFDDCYRELPEIADKVLAPREIPGIAFAVAGKISGANDWDRQRGARTRQLLDPAGLRHLMRRSIEIGCHSMSHSSLPAIPPERLAEETTDAADILLEVNGKRPRFFAYPYGEFDAKSRAAVAASFHAAFGTTTGKITIRSDRFALPRVSILSTQTSWHFFLLTAFPGLWASAADLFHRAEYHVARLRGSGSTIGEPAE